MKCLAIASALAATALAACPPPCSSHAWKRYADVSELASCGNGVLFNYEDIMNPNSHSVIACSLASVESIKSSPSNSSEVANSTLVRRTDPSKCMTATNLPKDINWGWWGDSNPSYKDQGLWAGNTLRNYMLDSAHCQDMTAFAIQGSTVGAVWAGSMIQNHGAGDTIIKYLVDNIAQGGMPNAKYAQYCTDGDPAKTAGMIIDVTGNSGAVKNAVQTWSMGKCWSTKTGDDVWTNKDLWFFDYADRKNGNSKIDDNLGTCNYVRVEAGVDTAAKCGIPSESLITFNPNIDFSKLQPGQPICCSTGKQPDLRPSKNSDGTCYRYTVQSGDSCATIRAKYYPLSEQELMDYNKNTYGWMGCGGGHPWVGDIICLSDGAAPRPNPNPIAECGMLAPGDKFNTTCPLNACCSDAGFCGLDADHCAIKDSPTGAPGTRGCYSNCENKFIKGSPPASFLRIGYFETWNHNRPCNRMKIANINTASYSHIHLAFGGINPNFGVDIASMDKDFSDFIKMSGPKKILSIGGWTFSNSQYSWPMFRSAVSDAHRKTFIDSLVSFANTYNLDGFDFDWEYPGTWDIPIEGGDGRVPYDSTDGSKYLQFIRELRAALPSGKSISIAAPASYWYLKNFPIKEMSQYLDYIVYMTYDFHGQWDFGNKYSQSGCPTGNCLRSHVNITETWDALAMITKAGVPSNKVIVGMGLYGRSFKQANPGCEATTCPFTGPSSGATPGRCTGTAGYISFYEAMEIASSSRKRNLYYDSVSDSWIMSYDQDQWAAFMDGNIFDSRRTKYTSSNLGGIVIWAIDLMSDYDPSVGACDLRNMTLEQVEYSDTCTEKDTREGISTMAASSYDEFIASIYPGLQKQGGYPKAMGDTMLKYLSSIKSSFNSTLKRRGLGGLGIGFLEGPMRVLIEDTANDAIREATNYAQMTGDIIPGRLLDMIPAGVNANFNAFMGSLEDLVMNAVNVNPLGRHFGTGALLAVTAYTIIDRVKELYAGKSFLSYMINMEDKVTMTANPVMITSYDAKGTAKKVADELDAIYTPSNPDAGVTYKNVDKPYRISLPTGGSCGSPGGSSGACDQRNRDVARQLENMRLSAGTGITRELTETEEDGQRRCMTPVYVVNMNGGADGVECNIWRYFVSKLQQEGLNPMRNLYTRVSSTAGDPSREGKPIHSGSGHITSLYNSCEHHGDPRPYELDEFPFNALLEGYLGINSATGRHHWDSSVLCASKSENGKEGTDHKNFFAKTRDWRLCDPRDTTSPERDGPLGIGRLHGQFYVVLEHADDPTWYSTTCPGKTYDPIPINSRTVVNEFVLANVFMPALPTAAPLLKGFQAAANASVPFPGVKANSTFHPVAF
ncbi:hypothetical protein GGI12_001354 [Dipsacomyces acuminosporus]|nr:hypothetical protein GGI12_001354 [Dipsacomyces acuminosporus]